jgi:hypothetical protein
MGSTTPEDATGDDRDGKIRQRAYERWEREGRPQGRAEEHWRDAERELDDGEPDAGRQGISNHPPAEEADEQRQGPPRSTRKQSQRP